MTFRGLLYAVVAAALAEGIAPVGFAQDKNAPPPTVSEAPAVLLKEAASKRYVGAVESIRHVDIMPRVTGTLLKIHFEEGAMVKAGDLLYELEDTTYRAAVDGLRASKLAQEAALRYASEEYNRNSRLLASRAVAVSSYDKSVMEIDSAKAKLKGLEASLLDAENTLSYTKIHAPLSGRIGKSGFTAGNLITPAGGRLADIEMIAPIYVRFSISERVFRQDFGGPDGIREKAVVRLQLADGSLYPETAKVTLIDNKINTSTNTIKLWATFQNKDLQLIPGGFVTALVSVKQNSEAVGILPSGLVAEENGFCVYVLTEGNKVERRVVTPGEISGGYQIIAKGLSGSERIVVDGTHKIKPGMIVTPVPATPGK